MRRTMVAVRAAPIRSHPPPTHSPSSTRSNRAAWTYDAILPGIVPFARENRCLCLCLNLVTSQDYWTSEGQPAAKLERTRAGCTGDPAEVDVVDAQLGIVVVRPVEHVEYLAADLHPSCRREGEALGERHVKRHRRGA